MKTKTNIYAIAAELRAMIDQSDFETEVIIEVYEEDGDIEVIPVNRYGTFYHLKPVVDICDKYGLRCHVGMYERDGREACIANIYDPKYLE